MNRCRQHVRALAVGMLLAVVAACSAPPTTEQRRATEVSRPAGGGSGGAADDSAQTVAGNTGSTAGETRAAAGSGRAVGAQASRAAPPSVANAESFEREAADSLEEVAVTGARVARGRSLQRFSSTVVPTFLPDVEPVEIERVDEVWIIAMPGDADDDRPGAPGAADSSASVVDADAVGSLDEDRLGTGALLASFMSSPDEEPTTIPLPLEHTEVHATIRGYVGTVDVTQAFSNPFDEKIEAVYMFPLPEKAAVREFVMTIGDRQIRGILREKEEAEQLYLEARAQGYRASLLVQHRPNVFEQKVANIEPGKRIDVNIRYFHTLPYHDGWYSFVFPTVVGPRYNPPGWDDPLVPVARGTTGKPSRGAAVRYLRPNERSAHDIGISVDIDAGVQIEALDASHPVETTLSAGSTARVVLAAEGSIPNRDFVLRFKVAGDTIKSKLLTYVDPYTEQGYFTMMVYPPGDLEGMERQPVEMVFVLDTSSSMGGRPIEQAKEAVLTALDGLRPGDTFQIVRFSNDASQLGTTPLPATDANLRRARGYVERLEAGGSTEMLTGIRAALGYPHDEQRVRFVTFMTDGYIGNEAEIIGEVHRLIGASRIFSFGVGNAVNRYMLESLASAGRGAVAYLGLEDSADEIMSYFFERISHPAMTDLSIDFGEMQATDVYPARLPDLFVGRPVVVTGKFSGRPGRVTVRGRAAGHSITFSTAAEESTPEESFIASLWARLRIADLADRQTWTADPTGELAREIRATALAHSLMSDYTAFVAVDASEQTTGTRGTTVYQAVPVPDGVRYETTVSER